MKGVELIREIRSVLKQLSLQFGAFVKVLMKKRHLMWTLKDKLILDIEIYFPSRTIKKTESENK